jgi:hypothetical protein
MDHGKASRTSFRSLAYTLWTSALLFRGCEAFVLRKSLCLALHPRANCHHSVVVAPLAAASRGVASSSILAEAQREDEWKKLHIIVSLFLSVSLVAYPAHAFDPSIFTNDYADPFHPLCKRHIEVSANGKTFHYSGTAVGPKDDPVRRGCTPTEIKQYKIRRGAFDGIILENNKISAGDGIHEGVWEPAGSASTNLGYEDEDGVRWNDGNKWIVQKKSLATQAGGAFFLTYIAVSTLAGFKELFKRIQSNSQGDQ